MSFFVRVVCRQRTSISGEDINGSMNRRIKANTNSVQNARVEERQQKISRASETSDRRREARLHRGRTRKLVAGNARAPSPAMEKGPPSFMQPANRTTRRHQTLLEDLRLSLRFSLSADHYPRASDQKSLLLARHGRAPSPSTPLPKIKLTGSPALQRSFHSGN